MEQVRTAIARTVRGAFAAPGGRPAVVPAPQHARFLAEGAESFEVHADVTTMMIGGIAALLLQMLHPKALAGVWDHSNFRADMAGRLRRTAGFIAVTTFGERAAAEAAIARVRRIHARVEGVLPDGTPYRADEPRLLSFVAVTEGMSFLAAWRRYREPFMPRVRQDRYMAEMAAVARALGAEGMPETKAAAAAFLEEMRGELRVDARTREVAGLIMRAGGSAELAVPQALLRGAAVDLLPGWAAAMHGLRVPGVAVPALRAGAGGMGAVLRWALRSRRGGR
ncbi:oxygenase MpaB family protein [Sandaracinobacteroides saxicola]|uniref:DUF2236 domain-containing protein n=1 Tax=Sandaracinobacteroides saxicola TaxID=2759707 RepID=A0A7G5IEL1_9SPHN|nr:oxygenase MpaB family protein [Sandaracinobacteroides saxicola]QMW21803.1 DUF2236 domain-containing protein [Sandaracinobacteroides saxicola]